MANFFFLMLAIDSIAVTTGKRRAFPTPIISGGIHCFWQRAGNRSWRRRNSTFSNRDSAGANSNLAAQVACAANSAGSSASSVVRAAAVAAIKSAR